MVTAGCSVMLSRPPPSTPMESYADCNNSTLPVWLDGYLALSAASLALIGFGGAALRHSQSKDEIVPSWDPNRGSSGLSPLLTLGVISAAATFGLIQSARYGLRSAEQCDAARAEFLIDRGWQPPPAGYFGPPDFGSAPRRPGEPAEP